MFEAALIEDYDAIHLPRQRRVKHLAGQKPATFRQNKENLPELTALRLMTVTA